MGAPGGIRTHTGWILRPLTLPLVYRGRPDATGAVPLLNVAAVDKLGA